ncbi:MAG: hypothetical protein ACKO96_28350 [Flammeovirgaceae bacterium]
MYRFQIDKQYKLELHKPEQTKKLTIAMGDCLKGDKLSIVSSNTDQLTPTPQKLVLEEDSKSVTVSLRFKDVDQTQLMIYVMRNGLSYKNILFDLYSRYQ